MVGIHPKSMADIVPAKEKSRHSAASSRAVSLRCIAWISHQRNQTHLISSNTTLLQEAPCPKYLCSAKTPTSLSTMLDTWHLIGDQATGFEVECNLAAVSITRGGGAKRIATTIGM
ncbi:hypothetical protein [Novipirellula sp.]|uniref:hypothetical protein n=1 Tax=Novipirellula sp. TaxID=2795430 RepID=UPI003569DECC